MSELEKEALDEIAKPKKRGRKKKNTNLITGDIEADKFAGSLSEIQKESMVTQEAISDILVESMKQAYLEWSYPGLFREKDLSEEDEKTKELIQCEIEFKDDLSGFSIYDLKVITPEDDIVDDAYQISPEDYYSLTKKDADDGTVVRLPFDVTRLDKAYVRRVKQLYLGKLKEASRQAILSTYKDQMASLIEGTVTKFDEDSGTYEFSFGKANAFIKKDSQKLMPGDHFVTGERVLFYLEKVSENSNPPSLDVNRTSKKFVEKLMEREIPEIKEGIVLIKDIAREPGVRSKVFVESTSANIDPIGTCIGPESSRQRSITSVLKGEKIDFCKYHTNKAIQIIEAMKPAEIVGMTIPEDSLDPYVHFEEFENDKDYIHPAVTVIVNNGAQGVAIGSHGSNVRLASRLTKCKLTVMQADDAISSGVKAMMTPEILKAVSLIDPTLIKPTPVKEEEDLEDEELYEEEEERSEATSEVAPKESEEVIEEVKEEKKEEAAPVVEEVKQEETPVKKEEPIEHIEIMNKPKISLESLEAALEQKKGPSETRSSYRNKKKEEEKKEQAPSLASQAGAMPIYTEEELAEFEDEEMLDEDLDQYEDEDLDQYDQYYDDDDGK